MPSSVMLLGDWAEDEFLRACHAGDLSTVRALVHVDPERILRAVARAPVAGDGRDLSLSPAHPLALAAGGGHGEVLSYLWQQLVAAGLDEVELFRATCGVCMKAGHYDALLPLVRASSGRNPALAPAMRSALIRSAAAHAEVPDLEVGRRLAGVLACAGFAPGDWGDLMLHALEAGNVAALSVALEFGPWDEAPPPDPRDLLRSVGVSGSLDCLAVMAEAGDLLPPCPREAREGPWAECVMAAAVHGHLPMLEVLCAWMGGALPDEWPGGRTLAHAAARGGRREVLHWLLSDRGSRQLRFVDDQGRSVLHEACEGPDPEGTLRALLANRGMRALVNAREARRARTALHLAARRGDAGAVRLLLGVEGTEAAPRDHRGCTPLVLALMGGHEGAAVAMLRARGAACDVHRDPRGSAPLHLAAAKGMARAVALVLESGAAPDARVRGSSALDVAQGECRSLIERHIKSSLPRPSPGAPASASAARRSQPSRGSQSPSTPPSARTIPRRPGSPALPPAPSSSDGDASPPAAAASKPPPLRRSPRATVPGKTGPALSDAPVGTAPPLTTTSSPPLSLPRSPSNGSVGSVGSLSVESLNAVSPVRADEGSGSSEGSTGGAYAVAADNANGTVASVGGAAGAAAGVGEGRGAAGGLGDGASGVGLSPSLGYRGEGVVGGKGPKQASRSSSGKSFTFSQGDASLGSDGSSAGTAEGGAEGSDEGGGAAESVGAAEGGGAFDGSADAEGIGPAVDISASEGPPESHAVSLPGSLAGSSSSGSGAGSGMHEGAGAGNGGSRDAGAGSLSMGGGTGRGAGEVVGPISVPSPTAAPRRISRTPSLTLPMPIPPAPPRSLPSSTDPSPSEGSPPTPPQTLGHAMQSLPWDSDHGPNSNSSGSERGSEEGGMRAGRVVDATGWGRPPGHGGEGANEGANTGVGSSGGDGRVDWPRGAGAAFLAHSDVDLTLASVSTDCASPAGVVRGEGVREGEGGDGGATAGDLPVSRNGRGSEAGAEAGAVGVGPQPSPSAGLTRQGSQTTTSGLARQGSRSSLAAEVERTLSGGQGSPGSAASDAAEAVPRLTRATSVASPLASPGDSADGQPRDRTPTPPLRLLETRARRAQSLVLTSGERSDRPARPARGPSRLKSSSGAGMDGAASDAAAESDPVPGPASPLASGPASAGSAPRTSIFRVKRGAPSPLARSATLPAPGHSANVTAPAPPRPLSPEVLARLGRLASRGLGDRGDEGAKQGSRGASGNAGEGSGESQSGVGSGPSGAWGAGGESGGGESTCGEQEVQGPRRGVEGTVAEAGGAVSRSRRPPRSGSGGGSGGGGDDALSASATASAAVSASASLRRAVSRLDRRVEAVEGGVAASVGAVGAQLGRVMEGVAAAQQELRALETRIATHVAAAESRWEEAAERDRGAWAGLAARVGRVEAEGARWAEAAVGLERAVGRCVAAVEAMRGELGGRVDAVERALRGDGPSMARVSATVGDVAFRLSLIESALAGNGPAPVAVGSGGRGGAGPSPERPGASERGVRATGAVSLEGGASPVPPSGAKRPPSLADLAASGFAL